MQIYTILSAVGPTFMRSEIKNDAQGLKDTWKRAHPHVFSRNTRTSLAFLINSAIKASRASAPRSGSTSKIPAYHVDQHEKLKGLGWMWNTWPKKAYIGCEVKVTNMFFYLVDTLRKIEHAARKLREIYLGRSERRHRRREEENKTH